MKVQTVDKKLPMKVQTVDKKLTRKVQTVIILELLGPRRWGRQAVSNRR